MITDAPLHNLALMKLSAWHKAQGHEVELIDHRKIQRFDKVYGSFIFTWNRHKAEEIKIVYGDKAVVSGTGVDVHDKLTNEIDVLKPDYSLFDLNYGVGFSRRGCPNKCSFCVVPKKEQWKEDTEIKDIINPSSDLIHLLDNNFTCDPDFPEKVKEINDRDLVVSLQSGVDARTIHEESAMLIGSMNHDGYLHTAWDNPNQERFVLYGIRQLMKYFPKTRIMVYVLIGYNTSLEENMIRIRKLEELKVHPYVMLYRDPYDPHYQYDRMDMHFKNWVNGHGYRNVDFKDFDRAKNELSKRNQLSLF